MGAAQQSLGRDSHKALGGIEIKKENRAMSVTMATCILYLLVNLVAFILYASDKQQARCKQRRISERSLLCIAIAGGAVGALTAMVMCRHKTRHMRFLIIVPLALVMQLILLYEFIL